MLYSPVYHKQHGGIFLIEEKNHNYFYKITNLVNGKYYYGIHSTNNLNDGYFGSGRTILKALKKHGKENFKKEIIVDYPTRHEASEYERQMVTLELIQLEECYNLRCGGDNGNILSNEIKSKISKTLIGKMVGKSNPFYGKTHTNETKQKISQKKIGIKLSEEHKSKLGRSGKDHHLYGVTGEANPLYGYKHSEKFCEDIRNRQLGDNNSFKGKHHTDESKLKIQNSCKQSKKCSIDGLEFKSIKAASRHFNIPNSTIKQRLKSLNPLFSEWKFI